MAKKKEESTNEKIVRLYKEGHSSDYISRTMAIPKGNIVGILEKYFPDYLTYQQPKVEETEETEDKSKKLPFNVDVFKRSKKEKPEEDDTNKVSINLEMDENGFVDRSVAGIAQMLKKGRSIADVAEFFNREKSEIKAVSEVMDEHFKRHESANAPAPAKEEEPATEEKSVFTRGSALATGLEEEKKPEAPKKAKYTPPTYSKRNDPKPVSASYGLAGDEPVSLLDQPEPTKTIDLLNQPEPTKTIDLLNQPEPTKNIDLLNQPEPTKNIDLVGEPEEKKEEVKLVPDTQPAEEVKAEQKPTAEEVPEMPSIEPISLADLDRELAPKAKEAEKSEESMESIPTVGTNTADFVKEENSGMSPMEKMKQFAQEQIAINNRKIEELKTKKVDAENTAFDCNTKVEAMKKQIEDMQAQLKVLIDEKNKAGDVVSGINDEIESINQENVEFGAYL